MKKKVSLITLVVSCLTVFICAYTIPQMGKSNTVTEVQKTPRIDCPNTMDQIRLKNFEYIQPLVLANVTEETNSMQDLKRKIEDYINTKKSSQQLEDITVYFRRMNDGSWFCINPNETYNPASMSKIIYVITYLKEAEYNPGVLNKKIFFSRHFSEGNQQNIKNFSLRENAEYTVKDLLTYMIVYSDNDATLLLSQNMNMSIYNQLFKDLNIPTPPTFGEYFISAMDYSKFLRVLYNASYIRPEFSEFGLKLLTLSTYDQGLRKGIDSTVAIAHKFGERIIGNKAQLHEFGIVFVKGDPYMIGVLTKGTSLPQLSDIVGDISKISFTEYMNKYHI